jgi:hypothetical protein
VSSREKYLQDHHRNLFGTDENTPFTKGKQGGQSWQSTSKTSLGPNEIFNGNAAGAG